MKLFIFVFSEGKYWKQTRSAVQQKLFKRKHTQGWFLKHLKVTDELLELLEKNKYSDGIVPDMNTILERYTLEGNFREKKYSFDY